MFRKINKLGVMGDGGGKGRERHRRRIGCFSGGKDLGGLVTINWTEKLKADGR